MEKKKLLVVIPCYKEKSNISNLLKIIESSESVDLIILVNDSPSAYWNKFYNSLESKKVRVLHHAVNLGKDEAIKTALLDTDNEKILILDADLRGIVPDQIDKINQFLDIYSLLFLVRGNDYFLAKLIGTTYLMLGEHAFRREVVDRYWDRLFTKERWNFDNEFNYIIYENPINFKFLKLKEVNHEIKIKKYGLLKGLFSDVKMVWNVVYVKYKFFNFIKLRFFINRFIKEIEEI